MLQLQVSGQDTLICQASVMNLCHGCLREREGLWAMMAFVAQNRALNLADSLKWEEPSLSTKKRVVEMSVSKNNNKCTDFTRSKSILLSYLNFQNQWVMLSYYIQ